MRHIKMIVFGFTMLLFTACGGSGDDSSDNTSAPLEINLIGTWDYQTFTKNSSCDGLLAQGVKIVESMNGDTIKMGDTLVSGTTFAFNENQQCYLNSIDKTTTRTYGQPSIMTVTEYFDGLNSVVSGDNTIKSITVDSFTNYKIQKTYTYTTGVTLTESMTR